MGDELLEVLDDILDNGTDIPPKVSNRMLLAAVRKNYRVSSDNAKCLKNELYGTSDNPGIKPRLDAVEEKQATKDRFNWIVIGAATAAVIGVIADIVLH